MRKIRAYLLFTSWRYRLVIFWGLPGAVLAGGLLWRYTNVAVAVFGLMICGIIFVEIMADQGVFNGIQSKREYRLDFFKTSPAGRGILLQGLSGDLVRRLLTGAVCIGLGRVTKVLTVESGAGCLGMVLAIYFAEVLGLFLSRFTRSVILCLLIAYGELIVGMGLYVLVSKCSISALWVADGLLALAAAAMSILVVRTGMKRWLQTYSDI